jgi:hypothetical protein
MSNTYRILNTNKDGIDTLYVFHHNYANKEYKKNITSKKGEYKELIGLENYKELHKDIQIYLINETIFFDDTIDSIKRKIIKATENNISFEEIYLFSFHKKRFVNNAIFEQLSQNTNLEITRERMIEYILNFTDINIDELDLNKETYSYDDIILLNIHEKEKLVKMPLGQTFFGEKEYPVTINPFDVIGYDKLLLRSSSNFISTQNKSLLLEYPELYESNIYLCTTKNVIDYVEEFDLPVTETLSIYFPLLGENNILTVEDWKNERENLVKQNKARVNEQFQKRNEQIHLFHNINSNKSEQPQYLSQGINYIKCIIHQQNELIVPLEIIFKMLKTTPQIPLIKYNPGKGRERMFRLHTDKMSVNGKKIPSLDKSSIMKLRNTIAKQKSIGIYFRIEKDDAIYPVIVHIYENMDVQIEIENTKKSEKMMNVEFIEEIIKEQINNLFISLQEYLVEHGYNIELFHSFEQDNVEVGDIHYLFYLPIKRNINVKKYKCFSAIFNVIEGSLKKDIYMRYKRVSYFNKMDSMEAFMIELANLGTQRSEIIEQLKNNFDLSESDANKKYAGWISNLQVEQQLYENRKLKIKTNPGFPVRIVKDKFKNNVTIQFSNINNINYLKMIPIYVDSLIKMSQNINEIKVSKKIINRLCSTSIREEQSETPDIDSGISMALEKQDDFKLGETGIQFMEDSLDDEDGLLGLLDEGDEDDSADVMTGGYSPDDKGESASSEEDSFELILSEGEDSESKPKTKTSSQKQIKESTPQPSNRGESVSSEEDSFEIALSEGEDSESKPKTKTASPQQQVKQPTPQPSNKGESVSSEEDSFEIDLSEGESELKPKTRTSSPQQVKAPTPQPSNKGKSVSSEEVVGSPEMSDIEDELFAELDEGSILSDEEDEPKDVGDSKQQTSSKTEQKVTKTKTKTKTKQQEIEEDLLEQDVAGMPLSNPNYFFQRMYNRDKKLFLKQKDGKFNAYSRICPHNVRRQPVILTEKEKKRIDKESPGSYDQSIKYGSDKDHQYYYICPRYWCLKTNTSMTKKQVEDGECGGSTKIIPKNARKVPKDAFVFEFSADSEHKDNKGKYIKHYPGFVKEGSHPDGLCVPCCFKSWDSNSQKQRRDICLANKKLEKKDKVQQSEDYIKNADKYPLSKGRWGFLPLNVQKMLHTNNQKCKDPTKNGIKPFKYCLLRKGVEVDNNQSFIGVIADLYVDEAMEKLKRKFATPSIKEMKQIIISAIDIDKFISYFNGSLIELFENESISSNIEKYKSSLLYKNTNVRKPHEKSFLKKCISSYENFLDYLSDDTVVIDHTFLWDIVSKPNPKLFSKGLNLAIMEITNNDVTDNIELLCPTNNYSSSIFDVKKPTAIIVKRETFYEPIYIYRDEQKEEPVVYKTYSNYNSYLMSNIKEILKVIKESNSKCKPLPSMPTVYKFKQNLGVTEIMRILKSYKFEVVHQIVNFNNSVIGLIISNGKYGYIPVENSSIVEEIPYSYMTNDEIEIDIDDKRETISLWKTLEKTVDYLDFVNKKTKGSIPCLPKMKVIEDELVVGILTETNQFIPLVEPEENTGFTKLESVDGYNFMDMDEKLLLDNSSDTERHEMVHKIRLEGNFYNSFRNTIKQVLTNYSNLEYKRELEKLLGEFIPYHTKLEIIKDKLETFMDEYIQFTKYDDETLMEIKQLTSCVNSQKCNKTYCASSKKDDVCVIMIPDKHLISGNDNKEIYYFRMADEFIRYGKIQNFMFKPKEYLSFEKVGYQLGKQEIILLDTILMEGYFDDLREMYTNKYIHHNVSEFMNPNISQTYNNKYELTEVLKPVSEQECVQTIKPKVRGDWKKLLPTGFGEIVYKNSANCTFEMMLNIIKDSEPKRIQLNIIDLKQVLISRYTQLLEQYGEIRILRDILKDQGKEKIIRQVLEGKVTMEQAILSEEYYITNFDIHLLSEHYSVPILLTSGTTLYELKKWTDGPKETKKLWVMDSAKKSSYFYIVKQPGIKRNEVPAYSILCDKENIRTQKMDLSGSMKLKILLYSKRYSFDEYIQLYKRVIQRKKGPLKLAKKTSDKTEKSSLPVDLKSKSKKGKNVIKKLNKKILLTKPGDE